MSAEYVSCPDCGPSPTSHPLAWSEGVVDWLFTPYARAMDVLWRRVKPLFSALPMDRLAYRLFVLLERLGLGEIVTSLRDDHNLRTRALWEEAERRGIKLFEFRFLGRSGDHLVARSPEGRFYAFDGLPRPRLVGATHASPVRRSRPWSEAGLQWMDDKSVMRERFEQEGIPVPRGGSVLLVQRALALFDQIGGTVIVKPRFGSRSRHTFTSVSTRSGLVRSFYSAQRLSPWVVVEQELPGPVFRATVVDGELIGVARRDLPQVVGDGQHTIAELVADANRHPLRRGPIYHVIPSPAESAEVAQALLRQGLAWQSVPAEGQTVLLGVKVNRALGGVTVDVTDQTHPDNLELFEAAASVVADPIIGLDFIAPTVAQPWRQQVCGVIECNSLPYIDLHHYPFSGTPRNVAGAVWDLIFPVSRLAPVAV